MRCIRLSTLYMSGQIYYKTRGTKGGGMGGKVEKKGPFRRFGERYCGIVFKSVISPWSPSEAH